MKKLLRMRFLVITALGVVFLASALAVWLGLAAFQFVTDKAGQLLRNPQAQIQMQNFKPEACLSQAQSLLTWEPWLARPVVDNLNNLKSACLEQPKEKQEGLTI